MIIGVTLWGFCALRADTALGFGGEAEARRSSAGAARWRRRLRPQTLGGAVNPDPAKTEVGSWLMDMNQQGVLPDC